MDNADMPAMQMLSSEGKPCIVRYRDGDRHDTVAASGLTKLEELTARNVAAMIGSQSYVDCEYSVMAEQAIIAAEITLKMLEDK